MATLMAPMAMPTATLRRKRTIPPAMPSRLRLGHSQRFWLDWGWRDAVAANQQPLESANRPVARPGGFV